MATRILADSDSSRFWDGPITMSAPSISTSLLNAEITVERSPNVLHAVRSVTGFPATVAPLSPPEGCLPRGVAPRWISGSSAPAIVCWSWNENPAQSTTTPILMPPPEASAGRARDVTHTDPAATARWVGVPVTGMVAVTVPVPGLILETLPSVALATHTAPAPAATPIGSRPTAIDFTILPVAGSSSYTRLEIWPVTHTRPKPTATATGAKGSWTVRVIRGCRGSIRHSRRSPTSPISHTAVLPTAIAVSWSRTCSSFSRAGTCKRNRFGVVIDPPDRRSR